VTTLTPFFSKRNHEGFLFLSTHENNTGNDYHQRRTHSGGTGTPATTLTTTHRQHTSFFSSPTRETPFSTASSHQYSNSRCRCRKSHGRRDTPPSMLVTTERIADENPTPRIVSLLVSSPARVIRQIPELRHRTPRRSGLAFATLDHRERDCRHDAVTACREHCRREHVSLLKAPTRRRPLFFVFPFGFDRM